MAKKYVHHFTKYVTTRELMENIFPILESLDTKEAILNYLNVDSNTKDLEVFMNIYNYKRNLEKTMKMFDFSHVYIYDDPKRIELVRNLGKYGITEQNVDIRKLGELINQILNSPRLLDELNNLVEFDEINVGSLLASYMIFEEKSVLQNFVELVNRTNNPIEIYQPVIRNKYYDKDNYLTSTIKMDESKKNSLSLQSFEGKVFEYLNFKDEKEASEFRLDHNLSIDLDEETISFLHFEGEEFNNDWETDLTIVKAKRGCIYINYGEHLFINNLENGKPITAEEMQLVLDKLKHDTPQNEFIKHVERELRKIQKMLKERPQITKEQENYDKLNKYLKSNLEIQNVVNFRNQCLSIIANALNTSKNNLSLLYQCSNLLEDVNQNILVKIKVTSSEPIISKDMTKVLKKF